jgi:predicted GNAT superfamily acetyltransferase
VTAGIAVKRIGHHPEMIMFFHVPAAVFLALAGRSITAKLKRRYREQVRSMGVERL